MSISSIRTMLRSILRPFRSWLSTTPAEAVFVVIRNVDVCSVLTVRGPFSSTGSYSSVAKSAPRGKPAAVGARFALGALEAELALGAKAAAPERMLACGA